MKNLRGLFFLGLCLSVGASADWTSIKSTEFSLKPPPKAGSAVTKKDFAKLHELQDAREDKDCKLAKTQPLPIVRDFFGPQTGLVTEAQFEKVEPFLAKVFKFTLRVSGYFKNKYPRQRPYSVDPEIVPCIPLPGGAKSYPSSHASSARTGSCILAKLIPAKAKEIEDYGTYLGDLRAVVGVHHPSDVEAGQNLGTDICDRLLEEAGFQMELKEATP